MPRSLVDAPSARGRTPTASSKVALTLLLTAVTVVLAACQTFAVAQPTVTTDTASPATAPRLEATVGVAPTATLIPTPAPIPSPLPSARVSPRAAATPAPVATVPPDWKRWPGSAKLPFTIAYPPDWLVDLQESDRVYFRSPRDPDHVWVVIGTTGQPDPTANIDALRDAYYREYFNDCRAHAVDRTNYVTYAGILFAGMGVTCDQPGGLLYARVGYGLHGAVPWRYRLTSPYGSYSSTTCACPAGNLEQYFQPMLNSLTIGTP